MINHARTLLLNEINTGDPAVWDRYMPVDFRPIELPSWLEQVRVALVGTGAWDDKTYNIEALLSVISAPQFKPGSQWLDNRTTEPQTWPFDATYSAVVGSSADDDTVFSGLTYTASDKIKPITRNWHVRSLADFEVAIRDTLGDARGRTAELVNGIVSLDDDVAMSFNPPLPYGRSWTVNVVTRPASKTALYPAIFSLLNVRVKARLFRVAEPGDEKLLKYAEWSKSGQPADMIAGFTLAYVYQASKLLG